MKTWVEIAGRPVQIEFGKLGEDEFGRWEPGSRRILIDIDNNRTRQDIESTVFHELVHAALHFGGVEQLMHEDLLEAVCHNLENLLKPAWDKANPALDQLRTDDGV